MTALESPTARALLALELVQGTPGITADRLADGLGVSERAARRYVAILRAAGIPIDSTRGPYGGYRVGRGLRLPPLVFTADEALALVMAALDGHHDAADPTDIVGSALGKIVRALPAPVAAQAEAVRRSTAPRSTRGAWWCGTVAGTSSVTRTQPMPGARIGSTGSAVSSCSRRPSARTGGRRDDPLGRHHEQPHLVRRPGRGAAVRLLLRGRGRVAGRGSTPRAAAARGQRPTRQHLIASRPSRAADPLRRDRRPTRAEGRRDRCAGRTPRPGRTTSGAGSGGCPRCRSR